MRMGYKVNEIFYSLQGEGYYAGTAAVFIRLSGCNLHCNFCDTKHEEGRFLQVNEILREIDRVCAGARPSLVVLTGGEPTLTADDALCKTLAERFRVVAMESNGTHTPPVGVTFLTISPKEDFVGDAGRVTIQACNELKLVYTGENDPGKWFEKVQAGHYFLQPCDTGDPEKNAAILAKTLAYIQEHPWWRLSLQTQKIINVR